jgi:hypothetical protein
MCPSAEAQPKKPAACPPGQVRAFGLFGVPAGCKPAPPARPPGQAGAPAAPRAAPLSGPWRRATAARQLARTLSLPRVPSHPLFDERNASIDTAGRIALLDPKVLREYPVEALARYMYLLSVEAPGSEAILRMKLQQRQSIRGGKPTPSLPEIEQAVSFYHELYDVPCRSKIRRLGSAWPPQYDCPETATPPTEEPTAFVTLQQKPELLLDPEGEARQTVAKGPTEDPVRAKARLQEIGDRDGFSLPAETLGPAMPSRFYYRDRPYQTYAEVATAIYGRPTTSLPVFCAPKGKVVTTGKKRKWLYNAHSPVVCSGNWLDTLGGWNPWKEPEGVSPAEPDQIPPFACFGSPHVLSSHIVLAPGGAAGTSGFFCRKRVFRVQAALGAKSIEDQQKAIAHMCIELRNQTWGEKYPRINKDYHAWCVGPKGPGSPCPTADMLPQGGKAGVVNNPPFFLLSREELLYFFGHKELYCRADRPGLTHFLYNDKWAPTFTCGVARGIIESGPFEEGVQVCAVAPFVGTEDSARKLQRGRGQDDEPAQPRLADQQKARLHCWRFNRPTCEEVSDPEKAKQVDSIWRSNVFDAFDTLREARRTGAPKVWRLLDLSEAEKLPDSREKKAFPDSSKDEGTFGVTDFCRFIGTTSRIQCGFTRETMGQWYELRQADEPESCSSGVCARGAFKRGYLCALFGASEYFDKKPHWMCGIDVGLAGRAMVEKARAICVGGARAKKFQSAKGDRGSLQCYERKYRWAESRPSDRQEDREVHQRGARVL